MSKVDCAVDCFNRGFNCSQAVLSSFSEELGLDTEVALKVAGAFGGGMGHIGETCGAVTGALMVIGLKYGKIHPEDNAAKEKTYALVQKFATCFKTIHGSIHCKELLDVDISTPEGMQAAREQGLFQKLCPKFVNDAAEIVEQLL
jgi:C_GCAxxG_C_C family probable redox protein